MNKSKKIKNILSCFLLSTISLVIGYTIWIPNNNKVKSNPIAIMLQQNDGSYKKANFTDLYVPAGFVYNNGTCNNGSTITYSDNGISIALKGNDQCTIYYNQRESDINITTITLDGTEVNKFPTGTNYTVTTSCTGLTANWNYSTWSLEINNTSNIAASCSIAFNTPANINYLNQHIINNVNTTQGESSAKGKIVSENGYRYEGSNPYNYVLFNNELWRIIGVFDTEIKDETETKKLTKIIRDESLGSFPYSANEYNFWVSTSGTRTNLNVILNDYYYNQSEVPEGTCIFSNYQNSNVKRICNFKANGIKSRYRSMIAEVKWYLGSEANALDPNTQYEAERGSLRANDNTALTSYGKIGLIYPSDFGYSVQSSSCTRSREIKNYDIVNCAGKSWLLKYGHEWTITPGYDDSTQSFQISSNGGIWESHARIALQTRPTLYLNENVYIVSGTGSLNDPYIINN